MGYWIVVVDDDPISLTNAKSMLNRNDMKVSCLRSGKDLLKFMGKNTPDLILLDVLMPEMDGFDTFNRLRYTEEKLGRSHTPVIFLTGEEDTLTEQRGLRMGASDFVHKPINESIVIRRIKNSIENQKTIAHLTEEATIDKLTGFLNKASGTKKISEQSIFSAGALMMIDLDNFKLVNDLYGHDMGDSVLSAFSDIVRNNTRETDIIARIGGDEFLGFFPDMEENAVSSMTKRLNEQLLAAAAELMGEDNGIPLGTSVGVAMVKEGDSDFNELFAQADNAMYSVKNNGKHGYVVYDTMSVDANDADSLDSELTRLLRIISERGEAKGALVLPQESFSWNYRYIERYLSQFGGVAMRILFSLSSEESGAAFSKMASSFVAALSGSLRNSDIILEWKQTRFLVVLPQLDDKDLDDVIGRIMDSWEKTGYSDRVTIEYASSLLKKK